MWWLQGTPPPPHRRVAAAARDPTPATMRLGQCLAVTPRTRARVRLLLVSGDRRRHRPHHRRRHRRVHLRVHLRVSKSITRTAAHRRNPWRIFCELGRSIKKRLSRTWPPTSRQLLGKRITFTMALCTFAHLLGHLPCLTGQPLHVDRALTHQSSS